ncbi:MAG: phosphatidate cytidylyltransferase [Verrucomicrobiota bacterium]|nr:phosphatidate cytidylyltransferase [Verrucomicrobiota bacterium]
MKRWVDLGKRSAEAAIAIAVLAVLISFAFRPWAAWATYLLVSTLTGVAIWEYERFVEAKKGKLSFLALFAISLVLLFAFFTQAFSPLFPLILGLFFVAILHFNTKENAIFEIAASAFSLIYIAAPMGMLLWILYQAPDKNGQWWLVYGLGVTKITDVGAYLGGVLFGKRKLAPTISPAKSVEGAASGVAAALALSFLFFSCTALPLGKGVWIWLALLLSVASIFGDLLESLLKRDANKKDSNHLPGLGGCLDVLDSLLFSLPLLYLYLRYL